MVRVADCIMGTGKSSAAITYMNEHPDSKFIYISPFLDEAERIAKSCSGLVFVEPSNKIGKYNYVKCNHIAALINEGRNISSTHQAFLMYTPEMLEKVKEQDYTLIIDENVTAFENFDIKPDDIDIAVKAGLLKEENGVYVPTGKEYNGKMFRGVMRALRSRNLIIAKDNHGAKLYYWTITPEFLTSFSDVFILTYLFKAQSLHHLIQMENIPYEMIGVNKDEDGTYRFCEYPGYLPDYVHNLKNLIHIYDDEKMNSIGERYNDLSMNWHKKYPDGVKQLKNNIYNFFRNIHGDIPHKNRLWGTYKAYKTKLSGKGYTKQFLVFNTRATNKYRDCIVVSYTVNVFMNASEASFFREKGIEIDEELYALSVMCQFLWRSAIREGKEIYLYLPSSRMRNILEKWVNSFDTRKQEGGRSDVL